MKHFINFQDYTKEEINHLIKLAIDMKQHPEHYENSLKGKKLYMLFEKTSTRTYLSFATGITELGGTYYCQNWKDNNFSIGDIKSELKYIGRNADVIMMRLKQNSMLEIMEKASIVPLINGCDNTFHPCQALADLLTIQEKINKNTIEILYIGARNNVFHSLLEIISIVGGTVYGFTPLVNDTNITSSFFEKKIKNGNYVVIPTDSTPEMLRTRISSMDVIYTDTWVDMEYFGLPDFEDKRTVIINKMLPYQLNETLLAGSHAIVMHDMPMHLGDEISEETADKHMDDLLDQAENRRHVQKALMYHLLVE
jgi:ornithine carbamoyltransferase